MKPSKICTFERYQEIVARYGRKGCATNDYIQRDVSDLIIHNSLYELCGESNAFLLVKRDGFWRVYYYLNDYEEIIFVDEEILETEILFRRHLGEPFEVVNYLEDCGFRRHLVRDQYAGMYLDMHLTIPKEGIIVQPAQTLIGVQCAFELFNQFFDKYSGDYVLPEAYDGLLANGSILLAYMKGGGEAQFMGALHQTVENNVAWLSHVAVKESARGHHVGQALLDSFVERNMVTERSRYMLWVQHQNIAAVRMYEKKGFKYVGKSSLSMIKL